MDAAQMPEDEARRRAFEGVLEGVYHPGVPVGLEPPLQNTLTMSAEFEHRRRRKVV
jgi:hypothetical protein